MIMRCCITDMFFFQAEDGIRDLVRSRGLGDVYKRQPLWNDRQRRQQWLRRGLFDRGERRKLFRAQTLQPVSYTHLTLPTSDLV